MKPKDQTCHLFRDALPAEAAGTLTPLDRRLVQEHLAGCPACTAEAAAWRQIRDAAKAAPAPLPSPSVLEGVWAELDRDERAASRAPGWRRWVGGGRNPEAARTSRLGGGSGSPVFGGRSLAALHLAATVALVAAIVGWALVGRATIPFRVGSEDATPNLAGPSTQVLAVDLPAAVDREPSFASLTRLALGPSDEFIADSFLGTALLVVDSGTVTIRPESAALVVRADTASGASAEEIEAGQGVELGRGDAISLRADAGYAVGNAAASEAKVIVAGIFGPGPPPRPEGPAVVAASGSTRLHLPAGPVTVDFARWIVPTATAVSAAYQGAVILWIEEGTAVSLAATDDSVTDPITGRDAVTGPGTAPSQEPPLVAGDAVGVKPGVEVELRNDDALPAVVLTLVVTPVEDAAGTPESAVSVERQVSQSTPGGEGAWRPTRWSGPRFARLAAWGDDEGEGEPGRAAAWEGEGPPPWAGLPGRRDGHPFAAYSSPPCERDLSCRSPRAPPLSRFVHP